LTVRSEKNRENIGALTLSLRRSALPALARGQRQKVQSTQNPRRKCNPTSCDFRHLDLRGLAAAGIDFTGCYFRPADLRGVDFSKACLVGVSINGARISGGFFPVELSAEEISLSIQHRTRMRYNKCARAILGASAKLRRATHALARIRKPLQPISKRLLSANRLSPSAGAETSGCRTYRLLPDCR
jgi:uncharacterized protein YjbI with pentapeptide repeats